MKPRTLLLAASIALAVLVAAGAAFAGPEAQTQPGHALDPRTYDPASTPFLTVHAVGVQRYACQANGTWLFTDPVATLFKENGGGNASGSHYLNAATGRPVWQWQDGSTVEAARTASAPGGAGNIAALLLQAMTTAAGGDGDRLAKTTWVQRLNTSGGVAPAGACAPGDRTAVPYETDYVFWKAPDEG
jgi:Protein of unknown function (DUF3455)